MGEELGRSRGENHSNQRGSATIGLELELLESRVKRGRKKARCGTAMDI
jgi:hypothetical protein